MVVVKINGRVFRYSFDRYEQVMNKRQPADLVEVIKVVNDWGVAA